MISVTASASASRTMLISSITLDILTLSVDHGLELFQITIEEGQFPIVELYGVWCGLSSQKHTQN